MKGVILAGGTGSRLGELTKVTNKHLLPIGSLPMIYHPIYKLKEAGIRDILIVTGREHMGDVIELLGSGSFFDCEFTYKVQDQAGGIAEALALAEDFVGISKFVVILGDNIFKDNLKPFVESFEMQALGAKVLLKEVPDLKRFGVPELKDNRIVLIEEKPEHPKSKYAVIGIYMYHAIAFRYIERLERSARGELEITSLNSMFAERGTLTYDILSGWWTDAGTPESYKRANELVGGEE